VLKTGNFFSFAHLSKLPVTLLYHGTVEKFIFQHQNTAWAIIIYYIFIPYYLSIVGILINLIKRSRNK